jgi:hypothetical protein
MTAGRRRAPSNLLARLKGSVTLHAGGLVWEIDDVSAEDMVRVSQAALDGMRVLRAAYPELIEERGQYHGGGYETPDEDGVEEYRDLPTLAPSGVPRRVGF